MIWPLENAVITQGFGENFLDYTRWGYPGHNGLDLWTPDWPPVIACITAGVVLITSWEGGGYGKYVVVEHPGGWRSYYAHLSCVYLRPGEKIEAGTPVGRMGDTGSATGPHLHLGVRGADAVNPRYRGYVDPLPVLRGAPPPLRGNPAIIEGSWVDAPLPTPVEAGGNGQKPANAAESGQPGNGSGVTAPAAPPIYTLPGSVIVKVGRYKTVYRMRRHF